MSEHENPNDPRGDCTTTGSFSDHGIADGTDLVTSTYYRLREADDRASSDDEAFFARLETAFVWAYLGSVDEPTVPSHVEAAVDDARVLTREEFADRPDADLRTDILPAFYRRVAGFHCRYRD